MEKIFRYGEDYLTAGKVLEIARSELKGIISETRAEAINKCAAVVESIADGNESVYGVNTGFGPLCTTMISKEEKYCD